MNVNQYICTYIHKYIYILYIYHKSPEFNRLRSSILDNFLSLGFSLYSEQLKTMALKWHWHKIKSTVLQETFILFFQWNFIDCFQYVKIQDFF